MRIKANTGAVFIGSPEEIIEGLHSQRYIPTPPGDGYIQTVVNDLKKLGIDMHVAGDTYHERADNFLHEMEKNEMIKIEEEN